MLGAGLMLLSKGGGASMTLSSDFNSPSGASPQSTASRTVTVPIGSSGILLLDITATTGSPNPRYNLNSAGLTAFSDSDLLYVLDGQTLLFNNNVGASSFTMQLRDNQTGQTVGSAFTVTCS